MSRSLNNPNAALRDYGATASTSNLPNVQFSPTEFMSLSEDVAHNINAVNSSCKQLEKILKSLGSASDQLAVREKVHNLHVKTNARIETTSKDLQRLTSVVRRGDKQQKLQLEKLTNDFQIIVEKYSTIQKRISTAMKQIVTLSRTQRAMDDDDSRVQDEAELIQRQRQEEAGLQFEQDMLLDREREIRQIEADILDVNAIMIKVSGLVQAQAEEVDSIENIIENAATEVEMGRLELAKASQLRQRYRRKMLIILAIAVIVGLIITGIIVGKIKS